MSLPAASGKGNLTTSYLDLDKLFGTSAILRTDQLKDYPILCPAFLFNLMLATSKFKFTMLCQLKENRVKNSICSSRKFRGKFNCQNIRSLSQVNIQGHAKLITSYDVSLLSGLGLVVV